MKRNIQLVLAIATILTLTVQCKVPSHELVRTVNIPAAIPSYPGGDVALQEFAAINLIYPETARENCIEGDVQVRLELLATGDIANAFIIDSVGFGCEDECLRLVSMMPKWEPAMMDGRAVASNVVIPIRFRMK